MNIELNLYKPFSDFISKLKKKYDSRFEMMNGFSNSNLNFTDFIDNFIKSKTVAETTIDANANSTTRDVRTLLADMVKPHTKLLSYNKIFKEITKKYGSETAETWLNGEWNGEFYLHNSATSSFTPYCYAYDLDKLVEKGLFFINKFKTGAPKHLTTFNDHVLEFISWASNRSSGAVGLPSYLLYSYYFWYNDVKNNFCLKDPEYYRKQCFQKFIYDLNQPYLRVTECAFSNISVMDRNYLVELFGGRQFPNGDYVIDHIEGIIEHQKVFMEVVSEIRKETMMTFPVLTYSLLFQNGKFVDEEFARWCNRHNMTWYDSNFYVGNDVTSLSNCCRLISNTSKLDAFINSVGGTSLSVGSIQVNTINLRRIAVEADGSKEKFLEILKDRIDNCVKVLDVVRDIIKQDIEKGLLPNYSYGLIEIEKQYNTIGITAMYEAISEFGLINTDEFGNKSYSKEGLDFATEILNAINSQKDSYTFDYSINVEAIPAERANVILSQKDSILYPEKEQYFIYSNQWIPLMEKCTLNEKIKLGAKLDKECGGGQISHINLAGKFASEEQAWELLNYIAKSGVIYFAYNCKISVCEDEHAFFSPKCPKCGKDAADTYSRIVGFLVPFSAYSKERKQEFEQRKWFDLNDN
ncbi:MAG: anaerobic ribonucleoside-triphosphate reductase [Clostridia bacterium]|nr:anaerobic ribonucleoside-triphosphate reductase [Clostridia bacterium]